MRWVCLSLLVACGGSSAVGVDVADTAGGGTEVTDTDDGTSAPSRWSWSSHPCAGSRTDAMVRLDDGSFWVGCGTTVPGLGLYFSDDGGETWSAPSTDPADYFDDFRVDDLWQAPDGQLYISGANTSGGGRADDAVVSIDPADPALGVSTVFANGDQVWNAFQVGTFRRTSGGAELAESLTGNQVVWRADSASAWQDGYGWWGAGEAQQLLDLETWDGGLYGCGSTIAQPPSVMLPGAGGPGTFEVVVLDDADGELWDLHVDADGIVAVGVDQDRDRGWVFLSGADPSTPSDWTKVDLEEVFPGVSSWADGSCRDGDLIFVVGRNSRTDDGLLARSTDGGATWEDLTPDGVPALSACLLEPSGDLVVTGGDGTFARLRDAAR